MKEKLAERTREWKRQAGKPAAGGGQEEGEKRGQKKAADGRSARGLKVLMECIFSKA